MKIARNSLFILVLTTPVLANAQGMDKTLKEINCAVVADEMATELGYISSNWLTEDSSPYNVTKAYMDLVRHQSQFTATMDAFVKKVKATPDRAEDLERSMAELRAKRDGLVFQGKDTIEREANFQNSLVTIEQALLRLNEKGKALRRTCSDDPFILETVEAISATILSWEEKMREMRGFVSTAAQKRTALFNLSYALAKFDLEKRTALLRQVPLAALQQSMEKVLAFSKIYNEYQQWTVQLVELRYDNSLSSKYMQFEEPIRILHTHIAEGEAFYKRMESLGSLLGAVERQKLSEIEQFVSSLRTRVRTLEAQGWSKRLEAQRLYVEAKAKLPQASNDETCKTAIQTWRAQAEKTSSLEAYRELEKRFVPIVDLCI